MRRLKRVASIVIILALAFLVVMFILENRQPTSLLFLGWSSARLPVASYVILALLLGMVVGPLSAWIIGRRFWRSL